MIGYVLEGNEVNDDDDDDDDDDGDVVLYIAQPRHAVVACSVLLGRVVSFEACCQWALFGVQITRHYPTIEIYCTEINTFILLSVKRTLGRFVFP